jgi:hypothetical protein
MTFLLKISCVHKTMLVVFLNIYRQMQENQ